MRSAFASACAQKFHAYRQRRERDLTWEKVSPTIRVELPTYCTSRSWGVEVPIRCTRFCRMAAPGPGEREILTWDAFGVSSRELAQQVADSKWVPDIILAIARGGLLPAGALGYALTIKNVFVISVEYYTGIDERLDFPVMLPPQLNLVDIKDSRVLIVDDVADTGHTLKAVQDFVGSTVNEARSAVIYEKSHSVVKCDFVWKRTDRWIDFPWSDKPPILGGNEGH